QGRHLFAAVAQSVEQRTENPRVDSSILSCGTMFNDNKFYCRKFVHIVVNRGLLISQAKPRGLFLTLD
ncbi:MAG: hypothetical protein H6Q66_2441, partial [Firmicutes bacterium]|nr:hypothetical protein [Bacillota bacterium]